MPPDGVEKEKENLITRKFLREGHCSGTQELSAFGGDWLKKKKGKHSTKKTKWKGVRPVRGRIPGLLHRNSPWGQQGLNQARVKVREGTFLSLGGGELGRSAGKSIYVGGGWTYFSEEKGPDVQIEAVKKKKKNGENGLGKVFFRKSQPLGGLREWKRREPRKGTPQNLQQGGASSSFQGDGRLRRKEKSSKGPTQGEKKRELHSSAKRRLFGEKTTSKTARKNQLSRGRRAILSFLGGGKAPM